MPKFDREMNGEPVRLFLNFIREPEKIFLYSHTFADHVTPLLSSSQVLKCFKAYISATIPQRDWIEASLSLF